MEQRRCRCSVTKNLARLPTIRWRFPVRFWAQHRLADPSLSYSIEDNRDNKKIHKINIFLMVKLPVPDTWGRCQHEPDSPTPRPTRSSSPPDSPQSSHQSLQKTVFGDFYEFYIYLYFSFLFILLLSLLRSLQTSHWKHHMSFSFSFSQHFSWTSQKVSRR